MQAVVYGNAREISNLTPFTLPDLAVARVSGADAGAFLQAQLSADVAVLPDGGATFACYCSPRGQVFGLLLVGRVGDEFRLAAQRTLLPAMLKRLSLFVLRARVLLEMAESVVVQGCLLTPDAPDPGGDFRPGGLGLAYRLVEKTAGLVEDQGRWKEQELRKKVVWLGPATSERFIPQMLGMEQLGAVSFSKGCYPGQEIIARARYLGKVKRKPLLLKIWGDAEWVAGEPLAIQGGPQPLEGTVIDSVALAESADPGAVLLFAVAPVPDGPVESVVYGGCDYRCATM